MLNQIINQIKPSFLANCVNSDSDQDAIEIIYWLRFRISQPNTYTTYRVVVFRFYLWMRYRGVTLKTISNKEISDYIAFMHNPPFDWCGSRHHFSHPEWKPFRSKLSQSSIRFNIQLLKQLFNDLIESEYLKKSPIKSNLKPSSFITNSPIQKCLTLAEFKDIYSYINQLPERYASEVNFKVRMEWVLFLLIYTAGRRTEIANAKMSDLFFRHGKLWLKVIGKGNKYGELAIVPNLEEALDKYRAFYGLPTIRSRVDLEIEIPLVIKSKCDDGFLGIHSATIWYNIKNVCNRLAAITTDKAFSEKLKKVSTHWFRHTSATLQGDAGIDIRVVQQMMRHKSIETTMKYQHVAKDRQHDEMAAKFII